MKSNGIYFFNHINFSSLYYDSKLLVLRHSRAPRETGGRENLEQCLTSLIQYEEEKCVGKRENVFKIF